MLNWEVPLYIWSRLLFLDTLTIWEFELLSLKHDGFSKRLSLKIMVLSFSFLFVFLHFFKIRATPESKWPMSTFAFLLTYCCTTGKLFWILNTNVYQNDEVKIIDFKQMADFCFVFKNTWQHQIQPHSWVLRATNTKKNQIFFFIKVMPKIQLKFS